MRRAGRRHNPVASDLSRERITATGLHGKSDEVIVVLTPGNAGRAKDLWLMFVDAKCRSALPGRNSQGEQNLRTDAKTGGKAKRGATRHPFPPPERMERVESY